MRQKSKREINQLKTNNEQLKNRQQGEPKFG